jgi:hypothetical protein
MTRYLVPLLLPAALALAAPAAFAQSPQPPRIVVIGEGEAAVAPDLALLSLGVMREADTAGAALDEANKAMAAVIADLKAAGVADRDLQTSGLQILPRYTFTNRPDGVQESQLVGYQVANTLSVRVREIGRAGELLDRAVRLGVNQNTSISFTNQDASDVLTQARKRAVEDAMARARTLAEAAGVTLGRVLEMSEQSGASPLPITERAFARAADAAPVEAGENAYRVQVTVTFELR